MDKLEVALKKKEKKKKTFDEHMLKFIQDPTERHCRVWLVFTSINYTVGYFLDPLYLAFHLLPLLETSRKLIATTRIFITLLDVLFTFFIAIPKEMRLTLNDSHDDPLIRKRERQGGKI